MRYANTLEITRLMLDSVEDERKLVDNLVWLRIQVLLDQVKYKKWDKIKILFMIDTPCENRFCAVYQYGHPYGFSHLGKCWGCYSNCVYLERPTVGTFVAIQNEWNEIKCKRGNELKIVKKENEILIKPKMNENGV